MFSTHSLTASQPRDKQRSPQDHNFGMGTARQTVTPVDLAYTIALQGVIADGVEIEYLSYATSVPMQ